MNKEKPASRLEKQAEIKLSARRALEAAEAARDAAEAAKAKLAQLESHVGLSDPALPTPKSLITCRRMNSNQLRDPRRPLRQSIRRRRGVGERRLARRLPPRSAMTISPSSTNVRRT